MSLRTALRRCAPLVLLVLATACGAPPEAPKPAPAPAKPPAPAAPKYDLDIPNVTYAWDPKAGDPAVPAEMGGPGFTGEGWQTSMTFPAQGDPKAVKGGTVRIHLTDWPATLRQCGKDWNESLNYYVGALAYESLLQIHPITLDFIPALATHWQISDDKSTYRYRINPKARWSDGTEVTAADVVATFKLRMDPTLLDPSGIMTFGKMEEPKAISKYIVEVKVKEPNWRNFLYFSGMAVFPAKEVGIKGSQYLDKYQFAYTANSGAHIVKPENIVTGQSITITRRPDWWDADNPAWAGMYNFDAIEVKIVKDPQLAFEMAKKGELDFYPVPKAQWWAEELDKVDAIKRGLLVKAKFYTDAPVGTNGFALNQRRPPLDDVRVREALGHLYDRKTMIAKLYFNEYAPLDSYYQGGVYQNPDNPHIEFDEPRAVELLEQAGWTEKNAEGYRVKDGKELQFSLQYANPLSERSLTIFQESCKRAGIRMDLQLLTPAAQWKNLTAKEFDLSDIPWSGLTFPNPETSWSSKLADVTSNNNVTSFKDARVDELCKKYDLAYDVQERIALVREIDGLIYRQHPYVLGWYNPAQRCIYWNRYGMPKWGTGKLADLGDLNIFLSWWIDPEMDKALEAAKADPAKTLPVPEVENRFWPEFDAARTKSASAPPAAPEPQAPAKP